jgi:GGDEF domain-containing protein
VATALRGGAPLLVRDVGRDSRFAGFADAVHDFVCQPVGGREGHAGAVTVVNKLPANGGAHRGALAEEDRELLGQLARYFHGAARQALRLAAKERARGFDAVTGLLSPRAFRELVAAEVRRATRFGTRFLLLACDVTPVAPAGAGVAVPQGREFFRTLGRRLRGAFREYDHVARVGPARFVVLLPEVRDGMTSATRRIEGAVGQERDRLRRLGRELQVEISFSQALFPDDGTTYEALALFLGLGSGKAR